MIIIASVFLVCSIILFVLADVRVRVIKRKFKINVATFDRLEKQFEAKCKAYNELTKHVVRTPLPDVVHKKTGNVYAVLCDTVLDCTNSRDGTEVVVYTRDGKVFVREKQEFMEKFSAEHKEDK